jgi:1-acyl-sn-glycerol-3-phosphate acyltransferase
MKSEVAKAPILSTFATMFHPIAVNRSSGDGFQAALQEITRRSKLGTFPPILIFPEGTVSSQFCLTMFKRGAFTPGEPVS